MLRKFSKLQVVLPIWAKAFKNSPILSTRPISAALHTPELGGHAVTGGPKFSPVTT